MNKFALALALLASASIPALAGMQVTVKHHFNPYPDGTLKGNHAVMCWMGSVYYTTCHTDNPDLKQKLRVGGDGDYYNSYIQWTNRGLPLKFDKVTLNMEAFHDAGTPVSYNVGLPNTAWASHDNKFKHTDAGYLTTDMTWATQPTSVTPVGTYEPGDYDTFWSIDLTDVMNNAWRAHPGSNYGLVLTANDQRDTYDTWYSMYHADPAKRMYLDLTITQPDGTPNYELPTPKGIRWATVMEAGGYNARGEHALWHDNSHFFTLNIGWYNKDPNGNAVYGNPNEGAKIPLTSALDGTVVAVSTDPKAKFGYSATVQDAYGNSVLIGHLKSLPLVEVGQKARAGKTKIGNMGCTGEYHGQPTCTDPNAVMVFEHNGSGAANSILSYALMTGDLLVDYQTEVNPDGSWADTSYHWSY